MNSRGRSLPGWGGDTTDADFSSQQRKWINAIGAVGEQELLTLFPQSWRMHSIPLISVLEIWEVERSGSFGRVVFHAPVGRKNGVGEQLSGFLAFTLASRSWEGACPDAPKGTSRLLRADISPLPLCSEKLLPRDQRGCAFPCQFPAGSV